MSNQKQIQFSLRDAQAMLAIARLAPINNMDEAEARFGLFSRFQSWAGVMLSPQVIAALSAKSAEAAEKPAETAEAAAEPEAETAALPENS